MRDFIVKCYREAVALAQVPDELKRSLNTQERVPKMIDNLTVELLKVPKISADTIRNCVYDLTNILLNAIEKKAREDYLSDAAKSAILDQAAKADRFEQLADEINRGDHDNPAHIDAEELAEL